MSTDIRDHITTARRIYILAQAPGHCQGCPDLEASEITEGPYCKRNGGCDCVDDPKDCDVTMQEWNRFPVECRLCPDVVWYACNEAICSDKDCIHYPYLEIHFAQEEANVSSN